MKKILIITIFITLNFNTLVSAEKKECRTFDIGCKTKKFMDETKEFQKKGLEDGKSQIKKIPENFKQKK